MNFQSKIPENGTKNLFKGKQRTENVPLIFVDANMLSDR